MTGFGVKRCVATDLSVELAGGVCPLCGKSASQHRKEAPLDESFGNSPIPELESEDG